LNPTFPSPANFPFVDGGVPVGQIGHWRAAASFGPGAAIAATVLMPFSAAVTGVAPGILAWPASSQTLNFRWSSAWSEKT
jgi:hypothetical protein